MLRCTDCGARAPSDSRFCGQCGAGLEIASEPIGERRHLTVLFIDMVGSTTLSHELDAEQLHDVYTAYRAASAEVVAKYDGHVAQFLGDGILVYFGYPSAHEDDPLRAVNAALEVLRRVGSISVHGRNPEARAAIHTGLVVVSDVGTQGHRERLATGRAPNVAARMQARAAPGSVVISEVTRRLVEGHFAFGDLGMHVLKGVVEPLRLFQILGRSSATTRFDARAAIGLAPFVGREEEVSVIESAWTSTLSGAGQALLLRGEAGIGKSRLLGVTRDLVRAQTSELFEAECSPYHGNSPFHPIAEMLSRHAGLSQEQPIPENVGRIEQLVGGLGMPRDDAVPVIAELLSIPTNGRYPTLELPLPKRRQRILEVLVELLLDPRDHQPTVLLIEDLHWADPSTMELVHALVERQAGSPLFLVCTSRPGEVTLPTAFQHCHELEIRPLPEGDAADLVAAVSGAQSLPRELASEVIARTGGVPLFIEAVIDSVLEAGVLRQTPDGYEMVGSMPPGLIPHSVHDSLTARIDRLGPDKPLAQIAAVIGREFDLELLRVVSGRDGDDVRRAVDRIAASGILGTGGGAPRSTYVFRHALIRDAAYATLLRKTSQTYHRAIAEAIVAHFPETAESQPQLVAHHFESAKCVEQATDYWLGASRQTQERWALEESIRYVRRAIALLETQPPEAPERIRKEMTAQLELGPMLMATRGWGSPEVEAACIRARDLCELTKNEEGLFSALWGLWTVHFVRGDMVRALAAAEPVLAKALAAPDGVLHLAGRQAVGFTRYYMGEFGTAREQGERALGSFELEQERRAVAVFQLPLSVACGSFVAQSLFFMGYPEQAEARHREALELVEALGIAHCTAYGLGVGLYLPYAKRDLGAVATIAERLFKLCDDEGFPLWRAQARMYRGWAATLTGDPANGLDEMNRGFEEYRRTGTGVQVPQFLLMLAEARQLDGLVDEALAALSTAMAIAERLEERVYEPELYRLKGEIEIEQGDPKAGEQSIRRALVIARAQEARTLELRAALSLAHHQRREGRAADAHRALESLCAWFGEGQSTPELTEARALLDETSA